MDTNSTLLRIKDTVEYLERYGILPEMVFDKSSAPKPPVLIRSMDGGRTYYLVDSKGQTLAVNNGRYIGKSLRVWLDLARLIGFNLYEWQSNISIKEEEKKKEIVYIKKDKSSELYELCSEIGTIKGISPGNKMYLDTWRTLPGIEIRIWKPKEMVISEEKKPSGKGVVYLRENGMNGYYRRCTEKGALIIDGVSGICGFSMDFWLHVYEGVATIVFWTPNEAS